MVWRASQWPPINWRLSPGSVLSKWRSTQSHSSTFTSPAQQEPWRLRSLVLCRVSLSGLCPLPRLVFSANSTNILEIYWLDDVGQRGRLQNDAIQRRPTIDFQKRDGLTIQMRSQIGCCCMASSLERLRTTRKRQSNRRL